MRMDIQAAVRLMMKKVNLDAFEGDSTVTFFVEWINSVLRQFLIYYLQIRATHANRTINDILSLGIPYLTL